MRRYLPNCISIIFLFFILSFSSSAAPLFGEVTPANSVIGNTANDQIGITGTFGLPSGNLVIVSANWNSGRGAVTCLTPAEYQAGGVVVTAANSLTGSATTHAVGSSGIVVLTNGNYVVISPNWDNGGITDVGAVTWVNGTTCIPFGESSRGVEVSTSNSLVGSTASDGVGGSGVVALINGNYVVRSSSWDSTATNVGAVTWGNGTTGIAGAVSASNSLVGSTASDQVGGTSVTALNNGNYVVASPNWDGTATDLGAVTWVNGTTGITGVVSASNSLVGSTASDLLGNNGVTALTNGNYVVASPNWDGVGTDMGAVTWGNGATGITGVVSASNSLVGPLTSDGVGSSGVTALTNGNYVVASPGFDGSGGDLGAVTWANGTTGLTGVVSESNSLVGASGGDLIGNTGVTALTNGNYVVRSKNWDGAATDVGAVTWGDGAIGTTGTVSASNSLVGSTANDQVGSTGVVALSNGNYVVRSTNWDGSAIDVGAVTWGDGTTGTSGIVSASNSLVGSTASDQIGSHSVSALTNGNYVVVSPLWDNVTINLGAVTWGNGTTGTTGVVSASNSLVGSNTNDQVGSGGVIALTNGNYVVLSSIWDGTAVNVGAATWGDGTTGIVGVVSASNSLVGSTSGDMVSDTGVVALNNGNYVVRSRFWDNLAVNGAGAATLGNGLGGTVGVVSAANSIVGSTSNNLVSGTNIIALAGGAYVVVSRAWDNGGTTDVGAVTYSEGTFSPPPSVTITQSDGTTTVTEGGTTDSYTVILDVAPSADVTITVTDDAQCSASVDTLTFTPANYATPQSVTITAVDDTVIEGDHTCTITHTATGGGYDSVTIADVSGTITDDDNGVVTVNPTAVDVNEDGTTNSYTMVLDVTPSADVTITITDDAQCSASVDTLTFTPANHATPQSVTITAVDDTVVEGEHTCIITHTAAGGDYDGVSIEDVIATITDDDNGAVTVNPTAVDVTEGSTTASYDVVLDVAPSADVTITISDDVQCSASVDTLTFTPANHATPQTVTIIAVDDTVVEGNHTCTITHTAAGSGYDSVSIEDVSVTITDDDSGTVTVNPTVVDVTEGSTTASYDVVLDVAPSADVTITIGDDAQCSASVDTLTFTPANHATPQTVTITAVDDTVVEGNHTCTITHTAAGGDYDGVTIADVSGTITDDEVASVSTELLTNPGFETAGAKPGIPAGWTIQAASTDKRVCPLNVNNVYGGLCAFKFTGSLTDVSKLRQTVDLTGLTFNAGDTLNFSGFFKGNNVTAKIKVTLFVTYTGNPTPVKTNLIVLRNATYTERVMATYTLTSGNVSQIKLVMNHQSNAGQIFVDDVSLTHTVPAIISRDGAALGLPESPAGFRGGN